MMKKNLLLFFGKLLLRGVSLFVCFFSISFLILSFTNTWNEAFSFFITNNKNSHFGYSYCEVQSNNPRDSYSSFFDYADDFIGVEAKKYSDTFFFSKNDGGESFLDVFYGEVHIPSSALGYSTYNFANYSMGMKTLSENQIRDLSRNEIYVTESLARILLNNGEQMTSIIGKTIKVSKNANVTEDSLTVVDVILDSSIERFSNNNRLDNVFLIYNYTINRNFVADKTYCVFLRGDYLSSAYLINKIETTIDYLNGLKTDFHYSSTYFDYDNGFFVGNNQIIKEMTYSFYSSFSYVQFFLSLFLFIGSLIIYFYLLFRQPILTFRHNLICIMIFLLLSLLVFRLIGGFLINNCYIFIFNSVSIISIIVFSFVLSGFVFLIQQKLLSRTSIRMVSNDYLEINI